MNKRIFILVVNLILEIVICKKENNETLSNEELKSCEKMQDSNNKFILKTNLSSVEIEELLSKDFSSHSNNKRYNRKKKRNNDIDVKYFHSKIDINKSIYLVELNNISEFSDENGLNEKESNRKLEYELIDANDNNKTIYFLSFDKFFNTQYKEMFEYSYTIAIFLCVLVCMIIYYTFMLPKEAEERNKNRMINNITENIENNINNVDDNNYTLKE